MRYGKMMLGAALILAGLATSARAQQFGVAGFGGNAFAGNYGGFGYNNFGSYGGFGYNSGFGGVGFGNGYGLGGYGYGNGYYSNGVIPYYQQVPTTYNNLGGVAGSIITSTGKANSYRYGYTYGQAPTFRRR